MRTISAKPLTREAFAPYGTYNSLLEPTGNALSGEQYEFFPDRLLADLREPIGFSPLVVTRPDRRIIKKVEIHTHSWEILLPLNDDMIIHVSPPNGRIPKLECTEAFVVPKGTLVKLNRAVWHMNPVPVYEQTLYVMAAVAQCTYLNDCILVNLEEEQQIEILL